MATTTNFGWETPDDTDLVKDGAAAIRTALGGVDTSFVDLKGGTTGQVLSKATDADMDFTWVAQDDSNAIQNAIVDAKGDLISATAADTPARLPLGTNGQVLKVNTSTATGLEWATDASGMTNPMTTTGDTIYSSSGSTPARLGIGSTGQILTVAGGLPTWATPAGGGGMTSIASGSLSGTALSLSSISGSYKDLMLVLRGFSTTTDSKINLTINGITSGYAFTDRVNNNSGGSDSASSIQIQTLLNYAASATNNSIVVEIPDYANTSSIKIVNYSTAFNNSGARAGNGTGCVNNNSAITTITATVASGGSFDAGTYTLYGVN